MRGESALIIAVPESEKLVAPFRIKYDPSASCGVPAHITLLYPFRDSTAICSGLLEQLQCFFASRAPFRFALFEARRFPDVLYLAPSPRTPFDHLTADLAAQYPETPPYGGDIADPIPHLTVGHAIEPTLSELASEFAQVANSLLPISCVASTVDLIVNEHGNWRTHSKFTLGDAA